MSRSWFRRGWNAALTATVVLSQASSRLEGQNQNFDTVQVTSTKVAGNVHMLVGSGGNIGLMVGDDAAFVVDDQFAPLTPKILAAIKAITPQPVRFVMNTHWHFDHTGGNENMGQAGALIFAQENVRKRMSTDQFIEAFKPKQPASPRGALPVVTFTDTVSLNVITGNAPRGEAGCLRFSASMNCSVDMRFRTFSCAKMSAPAWPMFSLPPV